MVKKADIGGKRLISLAPDKWVKWLTKRIDIERWSRRAYC